MPPAAFSPHQCVADKGQITARPAHEGAAVDIDRHGQLLPARLRRPDVQIEAVLADRHVEGGIAVKLLLVEGVHGVAELDALVSEVIGAEDALPGLGGLGLAPAQLSHRGLGIGHALIDCAAALLYAFEFSVSCGSDHGTRSSL